MKPIDDEIRHFCQRRCVWINQQGKVFKTGLLANIITVDGNPEQNSKLPSKR
jgi:hypothetical protein